MNKKSNLISELRTMLSPPQDEHFCRASDGLFYRFDDIDKSNWQPLPGSVGVERKPTSQCYQIKELKIYF